MDGRQQLRGVVATAKETKMNRDDIIRMAADAGITPWVHHQWVKDKFIHIDEGMDGDLACLMQFAALVAAAEREACAKVAEKMLRFYTQAATGVPEAIRARGE